MKTEFECVDSPAERAGFIYWTKRMKPCWPKNLARRAGINRRGHIDLRYAALHTLSAMAISYGARRRRSCAGSLGSLA